MTDETVPPAVPPSAPKEVPPKKVDEDWKQRIQTEREQAEKAAAQGAARPAAPGAKGGPGGAGKGPAAKGPEAGKGPAPKRPAPRGGRGLPAPSLLGHVETLATQALMALGEVAHPATGRPEPDPEQARYLIDTLDMLKQKTAGNLDAQEQEALENVLYDLRMRFVEVFGG